MLVVISDLHLTDGTSGPALGGGAFELFAERLGDLAVRASQRTGGTYRPIERIDLVLLGDVLDLLRSSRWLEGNIRPWHNTHAPEMLTTLGSIVDNTLRHNAEGLSILRALAAESAIEIPSAAPSGRPDIDGDWQPVLVRTHYMVGNHDWPLHLRGAGYDMLRQKIAHQLGLANPHQSPFPHEPGEGDELCDALRRHRVLARHGDVFDPINFSGDRDTASLGDAIVIDLLQRFSYEVEQELGDELPDAARAGLREIDNIRPLLLVPVFIDGLLERACPGPAMRSQIKRIWDRLADEFLELEIVKQGNTTSPIDLVDGLQNALKFSRRLSMGWAAKIANWLQTARGAGSDSYCSHALAEPEFRNRRARHVVYGHTHTAESVPLDASFADAMVLNQMYFNSGTWRRAYRQTQFAPGEHEFIPSESLNYLAFFQGDERGGRTFETWSGTLGTGAFETPAPRPAIARKSFVEPARTPDSGPAIKPPHAIPVAPARRSIFSRRG